MYRINRRWINKLIDQIISLFFKSQKRMFAGNAIAPIKNWAVDGKITLTVGIDIGGSGLRIRLVNHMKPEEIVDLPHVKAQSTEECVQVFKNLIETIHEVAGQFESKGAALALAGPIKDGVCLLTNWPGEPQDRTIKIVDLPNEICPHDKTVFLNDLEAGAYGVIAADDQKIIGTLFEQLWSHVASKGKIVSDSRTAVLAMGSGLGAALILKSPMLDDPLVLPTELGHMQIPVVCKEDPTCKEEYELIQHISNHYYDGKQTPEFEDIASGRGLCLAYQFFVKKNQNKVLPVDQINAGQVAEQARQGDKTAKQALTWHYKVFMRSAKAVATSLVCDSVILALDNQVKNAWFVNAIADQLHDEFYNFIRPDWMNGIRVYAQSKVLNFNLLGTAYVAEQITHQ
ncbi:putative glucokinase 2 [Tritrichomonas foetus]|uniref:Putative glucokinase 2 n=1 Tax=Tritrichomonas foetus TaxID=1144522 RepID=A0A1J4JXZ7_9EUKA|nr:putative glucokinase 2 [Tritrichomonas foetus]OHT02149.1 putative glucokinase 2 [Tritrichomonas foetus]|eukprot:OHT02149.1 putative glucokinase 2 [Tritrichomonas foetus]